MSFFLDCHFGHPLFLAIDQFLDNSHLAQVLIGESRPEESFRGHERWGFGRPELKMGRQPRSGDIPWLSAHSILNWIGGDTAILNLFAAKSRNIYRNLRMLNDTTLVSTAAIIFNRLWRSRPHRSSHQQIGSPFTTSSLRAVIATSP
jgi:hypothetical protein